VSCTALVPADIVHPWGGPMCLTLDHAPEEQLNLIRLCLDRLFHESREHRATLRKLENATFTDAPRPQVVALNDTMARAYQQSFALPAERVHIIPPGVATWPGTLAERQRIGARIRHGLGIASDACVGFFPAVPIDAEVARTVFAAWRSAAARRPNLLLLAGGDLTYTLQHLAVQARVRDRVRLAQTTHRLEHLYFAADFTLAAVKYHPCSRAVLQSLNLGVPVIASAGDGAAAYLTASDGQRCGRVLENPLDPVGLMQAILDLAQPEEQQRCRQAAVRMSATLALSRHVEELSKLCHRVWMEKRGAGRG